MRHALTRLRLRVVEPPEAWVTNVGIVETGETARREGDAWWLPALHPGPFTLWASRERSEDRAAVMVRVAFDGVNLPEVVLPAR